MKKLFGNNIVQSYARGMSVLVVDYDTPSLMYQASLLEQCYYKVATTELASVALSMIQQDKDRFKLVLANVHMPDMDCLSFLRVILKEHIPVILLAPQRNLKLARRVLTEGASFFLEKPISLDDVKYLWQHIYKMGRQPSKKTDQKEDQEILMNLGNASDQAAKINFQAGGSDLLIRNTYNYNNKLRGVADAVLDELRLRESLRSTTYTQQYTKENYKLHAQGGLLKTKRILMNDDVEEDQKEKRIKSDDHFVIKSEDQTLTSNDDERKKTDKSSNQKKSGGGRRNLWTPELHNKFVAAISALGDKKARPKKILRWMNVPDLTMRQVASHLQKYKAQVRRIYEASTTTVPIVVSRPPGRKTTGSSSNTFDKIGLFTSRLGHGHFVIPGMTRAADFAPGKYNLGSSGNVYNASKSVPTSFTAPPADPAQPEHKHFVIPGNYNLDSSGNMFNEGKSVPAFTAPSADPAPPVCPLNQDQQPSIDYDDVMKFLDEDQEEEFKGLDSGLNPDDVDRFCEWLANDLLGENAQIKFLNLAITDIVSYEFGIDYSIFEFGRRRDEVGLVVNP
ncbi:hypothetical protein Dsin_028938 [Dipteronia sinensis]|uniref:Uncharacterized protein n=1 Tax=Dipteronia sinensis TaxID=43782 RepID=A0AAD9ZRQ3_9ROSI|nr:hypothetical protein Dsin_028938 [Dipteronia sinensis]